MQYRSFTLGFTCCLLLFLSILCFLIEIGQTERGSGRITPGFSSFLLAAEHQGSEPDQKPDREPEKGPGRKD